MFAFGDASGNGAGWLAKLGVEDFAGGTAVHINAGAAGLALAIVLGKRNGWPKAQCKPHNLPFVMLGAGLLWFGWFGFNAGSALAANGLAGAGLHQHPGRDRDRGARLAPRRAVPGRARHHPGRRLGRRRGPGRHHPGLCVPRAVVGDPAGPVAGVVCAFAVGLKYRLGFDDSLDVVGVHLVGGIVGCLFLGFFSTAKANVNGTGGAVDGLFYGGGFHLLGVQALAAGSVLVYSFVLAFVIGYVVDKTMASGSTPRTRRAASTSPSTSRPRTSP